MLLKKLIFTMASNNLYKRPNNIFKRPNNIFYGTQSNCFSAQIILSPRKVVMKLTVGDMDNAIFERDTKGDVLNRTDFELQKKS